MNCKEAIKELYSESEDDSSSVERRAAKEHVFSCPECRRFFESEREIKNLVFEKAPRRKAHPHLKERIFRRIRELDHPSYFVSIRSLFFKTVIQQTRFYFIILSKRKTVQSSSSIAVAIRFEGSTNDVLTLFR